MLKYFSALCILCLGTQQITAQTTQEEDTLTKQLKEAVIRDSYSDLKYMNEVQGTMIVSGKKNEVIRLAAIDADLSINNARQIFGKVPGVSIWENDGSGIQLGIATRGLSPNRSWEFNVRQNGYDIASEAFGYPEAYYTPPMEALEKVEVIRGAASLQYGTQFGGLLNFVTKKKLTEKPFGFESSQTIGNYGLFNSYNAIGGQYKKLSYYAYMHHRNADGWRENSQYKTNTGFIYLSYACSSKLKFSAEYTHMDYLSQQAGGLTDLQFSIDPQQSIRSRNWMSTPWNSSSISMDYDITSTTKLSVKLFSTNAQRNSIGFTKAITIADTFNTTIGSFNNRQIDRDWYNNQGLEARILKTYGFLGNKSSLAAGVRAYQGNTIRKQKGVGSGENDYDLTITSLTNGTDFANNLNLDTKNVSLFAENLFKLTNKLSFTPGARFEFIDTKNTGNIGALTVQNSDYNRSLVLLGAGLEYDFTSNTNLYANYSQGFRPVLFSEMIPSATTDSIDANLKDVRGYNADFGFRGSIKNFFRFDVGGFILGMDNRVGTIKQANNNLLKTNIGPSLSTGIEAFAEIDLLKIFIKTHKVTVVKLFGNYAFVDARYTGTQDATRPNAGKEVENSPDHIIRGGITFKYNQLSTTFQYNFVDQVFTDASNTVAPSANAQSGVLPSYQVMDISMTYTPATNYTLKAGVNNLANEVYATRRAGGYPGPGLLPGNGRTFYLTLGFKL